MTGPLDCASDFVGTALSSSKDQRTFWLLLQQKKQDRQLFVLTQQINRLLGAFGSGPASRHFYPNRISKARDSGELRDLCLDGR
jgi:hypothetical protein